MADTSRNNNTVPLLESRGKGNSVIAVQKNGPHRNVASGFVAVLLPVLLSLVIMNRKNDKVRGVHVEVGGDPGFTVQNHKFPVLVKSPWEGATTLAVLFEQACKKHSQMRLLGSRKLINRETHVSENGRTLEKLHLGSYEWLSYAETFERACNFASGLVNLGHRRGERAAIFAETQGEWFIALQGCFRYNITVVTIYASLGEEALIHSLNEAKWRMEMLENNEGLWQRSSSRFQASTTWELQASASCKSFIKRSNIHVEVASLEEDRGPGSSSNLQDGIQKTKLYKGNGQAYKIEEIITSLNFRLNFLRKSKFNSKDPIS